MLDGGGEYPNVIWLIVIVYTNLYEFKYERSHFVDLFYT